MMNMVSTTTCLASNISLWNSTLWNLDSPLEFGTLYKKETNRCYLTRLCPYLTKGYVYWVHCSCTC